MKGISKKLLAIIIAAILSMSVFAVGATAYDDEYEEEDYFYDSVLQDNIWYDVIITSESSFASVSYIERDEEDRSLLDASVTIPETISYYGDEITVTEIGFSAFAECETLREITLPSTITAIWDYAFSGAQHLEKVVIPETIEFEYFGVGVFEYTPALGYFAENSENGEIVLGKNVLLAYLGNEKSYTVPEEIDFIADYCFFMAGVEEITLNGNVAYLPDFAFASCRNLKEITIPDCVTEIGTGAFADCTKLSKVNLGDSLEYIGIDAFRNTAIEEIYLGASLYDAAGAFTECNKLAKINISKDNEHYSFKDDALYYSYSYYETEEDEYAGNLTTETYLEYFLRTSEKTTFTVPEDVVVIGSYAFYNCKNLDEVILTSPVTIWEYAFSYCEFERFDFSKVISVGYHAFSGCKNLESADLSGAYYIDSSAFENCTKLADVTFSSDLYSIGSDAFAYTAISEVSISGDYCSVSEGAFSNCPNLKRVNFNDGVCDIYSFVFTNCPKLERVYISKTVEYIDEYAFAGCQDVTFELVEHSTSADIMVGYAEDDSNDVTHYEFVGKVSFFERVRNFFTNIFTQIADFLFGWIRWNLTF